jgi:hypothetical protein
VRTLDSDVGDAATSYYVQTALSSDGNTVIIRPAFQYTSFVSVSR